MKKTILFFMALALISTPSLAEEKKYQFGWMDFGSCNRIKHYKDSFGITWPTNESVGQKLYGYIITDIPNNRELNQKFEKCAQAGVVAAGLSTLLTGPQGAWPTFCAAFEACAKKEGAAIAASALRIEVKSECNW